VIVNEYQDEYEELLRSLFLVLAFLALGFAHRISRLDNRLHDARTVLLSRQHLLHRPIDTFK
jgi:hypothetical protein